ncbi:enoyl-CoA hydratase/isomerase family protein [Mycolicibacterium peregrinum]
MLSRDGKLKSVERESFEDYKQRFSDFAVLNRRDGIIEVRLHRDGGPALWNAAVHSALGHILRTVSEDADNEVMILTGTGDSWITPDFEFVAEAAQTLATNPQSFVNSIYDGFFVDGTEFLEAMVSSLKIPTIGIINGPGIHTEFPLLCDITLCAEDTFFGDQHFIAGLVPGDGQYAVLKELLGSQRANLMAYTGHSMDAQTALNEGVVAEVLPREQLLPRAWDIAGQIMQKPRVVRRMTAEVVKRKWRQVLENELRAQLVMESFAAAVSQGVSLPTD